MSARYVRKSWFDAERSLLNPPINPRYEISTIGPWDDFVRVPETVIFSEPEGATLWRATHGYDLDEAHEEICRRFMAGEIDLGPTESGYPSVHLDR
jgi:hypothetical protein